MKRILYWILSFILLLPLILLLAWGGRETILYFTLPFILKKYDIQRIRYENLQWDRLEQLCFLHLEIERKNLILQVDTLTLIAYPEPQLYIAHAKILSKEISVPISSIPSQELPTLPPLPLERIRQIFYWSKRITSLHVEELILPQDIRISLHKDSSTTHLTLWYKSDCAEIDAIQQQDTLWIEVASGQIGTERNSHLRWKGLTGKCWLTREGIAGTAYAWGLTGYHRRIAAHSLSYDSIGISFHAGHTQDTFWLVFSPQAIPLQGTIQLRWLASIPYGELHLHFPRQPHAAYLQALPAGFFQSLSHARIEGFSTLSLTFTYSPNLPDTLSLWIDWQPEGFSIHNWEGISPLLLQKDFEYAPAGSTRKIWLGPDNPNFLCFHQIPPYILHAVLHSEDGIFFYHKGFQKEHFLKAILENWRCRCFRRGAGTITMQVVRNLILSRSKTIARKIEEILLTAIIERFQILSKNRIAELYFNMAEWGPDIYGITEASHFYFAKEPHELTIPEAIFLGLLLPYPRHYTHFIDKQTGCAHPYLQGHFRTISHYLVLQNYLHPDSVETVVPERVCLKPPAWTPPDTTNL
ncbi:MAG: transglycosylase domain-containing protein [Bacteroidia bacterium]|nr:transglycosylase domain-containing protein [Bacteroidia bacterium]MDW8236619.1 biosynthetic peptidoglycan transglycosylase [Bacteroidia bacterium]